MKKLLVILMLGAGFVTTASADEPIDCTNNTTNQCCIDVSNMTTAIHKPPSYSIKTTDKYSLEGMYEVLFNDGTGGSDCIDQAEYLKHNDAGVAFFAWVPGSWTNSITRVGDSSSAK